MGTNFYLIINIINILSIILIRMEYFERALVNIKDNFQVGYVELINVGGTYGIWIVIHYMSSQLYVRSVSYTHLTLPTKA